MVKKAIFYFFLLFSINSDAFINSYCKQYFILAALSQMQIHSVDQLQALHRDSQFLRTPIRLSGVRPSRPLRYSDSGTALVLS